MAVLMLVKGVSENRKSMLKTSYEIVYWYFHQHTPPTYNESFDLTNKQLHQHYENFSAFSTIIVHQYHCSHNYEIMILNICHVNNSNI